MTQPIDLDAIERAAREASARTKTWSRRALNSVGREGFAKWVKDEDAEAFLDHSATSCPSTVLAMVARIREQDATIAKLVEAIEPIAYVGSSYTVQTEDEDYVFTLRRRGANRMSGIRTSDLRRATRVLAEVKQGAVTEVADTQKGK